MPVMRKLEIDELDQAVGQRLKLEAYECDADFSQLLPRDGVIEDRLEAGNGVKDWYLVRLDESFEFEGVKHTHVLIRARRPEVRLKDPGESSVFILLMRDEMAGLSEPIDIRQFIHVGSGIIKVAFDRAAVAAEKKRKTRVERVSCKHCGVKMRTTDRRCPECRALQFNPFSEEMTLILKLAVVMAVMGIIGFGIYQLDPRYFGFIQNGSTWEKAAIAFVVLMIIWAVFDTVVRRVFKR